MRKCPNDPCRSGFFSMRVNRIYQALPLKSKTEIVLDHDASRHLAQVLRCKINDEIILFNGEGGQYHAKIIAVTKKQVTVLVSDYQAENHQSPLHIHLGQAISRSERMRYTLQKAVELGVSSITPVMSEHSAKIKHDSIAHKQQHWQGILIAACEQSGCNIIPTLHEPLTFNDWVKEKQAGIIMDPHATHSFHDLPPAKHVNLLAGCEGGFSRSEIELAKENNFTSVKLGPRILRTETAAVAAIAILQYQLGDL